MSAGQPAVEWHQAGLRAEADQGGDDEDSSSDRTGWRTEEGQLEERDPDSDPADMGDREVHEGGSARGTVGTIDQDDGCRDQGHQLPPGEKREDVPGADDHDEHAYEEKREGGDRGRVAVTAEVTAHIDKDGNGDRG